MAQRFEHLLQPIRDLALNWDIDVASELEQYLDEIEGVEFQFEGTAETLNFAEAALLIQGTTCIYSKKVEHLYQLVYETLDLLASTKKLAQSSSVGEDGKDLDTVGLSANDVLSFLPLDDIAEDSNIDLDDAGMPSTSMGVPRMPLVLVPLTEGEKQSDATLMTSKGVVFGNRSDFKMNTSIVHESGTLLLGVEDAHYLDHSFQPLNTQSGSQMAAQVNMDGELGMDDDDDADAGGFADAGMDDDFDDFGNGDAAANMEGDGDDFQTVVGNNGSSSSNPVSTAAEEAMIDMWAPLDPHAFSGEAPKQPRRIKTYRVPASVKAASTKKKSSKKAAAAAGLPLESISDFCADTMMLMSGTKAAPKSGAQAPAYPEFASLFWAERKRRKEADKKANPTKAKQQQQQTGAAGAAAANSGDSWANGDAGDLSAVSMAPAQAFDDDDDEGGFDGGDDDGNDFDIVGLGDDLEMPAGLMSDQPDFAAATAGDTGAMTYEDLVRAHIESYVAESKRYVIESDLSARLREWEEKVKPMLEEEATRIAFDIHSYGRTVLTKMPEAIAKQKGKSKTLTFEKAITAANKYEVSRMFLATLQLANNGNVEIVDKTPQGEISDQSIHLKLLSNNTLVEQFAVMNQLVLST